MVEIERKFLVNSLIFVNESYRNSKINQGYLNSDPERTVRIRIMDNSGYITIKGKSNDSGTTRFEWEKQLDIIEAESLLKLCEDFIIEKTRYLVNFEGNVFEVDVFHGHNEGLVMAEIELKDEEEVFSKPLWLGEEVTGDKRFYNSYLSKKPYKEW